MKRRREAARKTASIPCFAALGFAFALLSLLGTSLPAEAVAGDPAGRFLLGLGARTRTLATMSFGDIRPLTRGELGGQVDMGYRVAGTWWAAVAGCFGGAWFDFNGHESSGKIEDFTWLIRGGPEWRVAGGRGPTIYFGLGAEYGESRSWLDVFPSGGVSARAASEEGPHVFHGGGYFRAGAEGTMVGPVHGYFELGYSAYHAHARQARLGNKFNWLGQSLEAGAGLRLVLLPDRARQQ